MKQQRVYPAAPAGPTLGLPPGGHGRTEKQSDGTTAARLGLGLLAGAALILAAACGPLPKATSLEETALQETKPEVFEEAYTAYFAFNSDRLDGTARSTIAEAVASAKEAEETKIVISGHSDRKGSAAYNRRLAEARVEAVASAFIGAGVLPSKIEMEVFGEERPQVPTPDGKASANNRRAEIRLVKSLPKPAAAEAEDLSGATAEPAAPCDYVYIWSGGRSVPVCLEKRSQALPQPN